MAKKKRPAKKAAGKSDWKFLALESMFKEGMKQDSIALSDEERESLSVIMHAHRTGDAASALRLAVTAEAELAKAGRSSKPKPKPTVKSKALGRPVSEGGGYRYLFPFRTSQVERDAVEVLKETHGVIKSVAIRHAINQEAKRCGQARKSR